MKIGQEFIEKTKYKYADESDQEKGMQQPPLEKPYDNKDIINLKKPVSSGDSDVNLLELINQRTSVRSYADEPISQEELSCFLWCTQGVKKTMGSKATFRTVPSAGARHALETYLLINRVMGIVNGVYRYIASKHAIVPINLAEGLKDTLTAACFGQGMVSTSAVTFFWTADIKRMTFRYGQRGYRYLHLDAGHVCQNLHLVAESRNCGVCAIAAFDDDEVNSVWGLDGQDDFIVYIAALGRKKK
ncbi:MAG: SagB/ThcOx family dehydrogenase [Clostridiales bacterium]|nr:SagB/ThcOx family dehydrogenase [Clostridiales bacterium]